MAKLPEIIRTINLESVGEITNETWRGIFRVKVVLTHSERFAIERHYKKLLPDDSNINENVKLRCAALAELSERIVECPEWFKNSRMGIDLIDVQPVYDLLGLISGKFEEWQFELGKMATPDKETSKPV